MAVTDGVGDRLAEWVGSGVRDGLGDRVGLGADGVGLETDGAGLGTEVGPGAG